MPAADAAQGCKAPLSEPSGFIRSLCICPSLSLTLFCVCRSLPLYLSLPQTGCGIVAFVYLLPIRFHSFPVVTSDRQVVSLPSSLCPFIYDDIYLVLCSCSLIAFQPQMQYDSISFSFRIPFTLSVSPFPFALLFSSACWLLSQNKPFNFYSCRTSNGSRLIYRSFLLSLVGLSSDVAAAHFNFISRN